MNEINDLYDEEATWSPRLMSLRETIEDIGKDLPPEDDWMPVVMVEGIFPADMPGVKPEQIGQPGIIVLGMAGNLMNHDAGKDFVAIMMEGMAEKFRATAMTFISTAWASTPPARKMSKAEEEYYKNESEEETRKRMYAEAKAFGRPSEDPNRKEIVIVLSVAYGGEDDGTKIATADIVRSKGPPQLTNWKIIAPGVGFTGRFPDAIYQGLKKASEIRAKEGQ
jgi:hypothetical protein